MNVINAGCSMSNLLILVVASLAGAMVQAAETDRDVSIADRCDPTVGATVIRWIEVDQNGQETERRLSVCHQQSGEQANASARSGAQR